MATKTTTEARIMRSQRWRLLRQLSGLLDKPMTVLAFAWLGLVVLDFTEGLSGFWLTLNYVIWGLFALHFALEFWIAPDKTKYVRRNWLTAFSLMLPAFRVVRVLRAFRAIRVLRAGRAARSVGLLRLVTSLNRGMGATRQVLQQRGLGYAVALTALITFGGAAGMYRFESPQALREAGDVAASVDGQGLRSYGESLWWTTMIMTTMGTDYWPRTVEGRLVCGLLAVYAFAVFGYITASIASYFVGQDKSANAGSAGKNREQDALRAELAALRSQVAALQAALEKQTHGGRSAPKSERRVGSR